MQLAEIGTLKLETVSTSVTGGELVVDPAGGMERLVDIADVMNQESHGHGHSSFLGVHLVSMGHDGLEGFPVLVAILLFEPGNQVLHYSGGVDLLELEVRVVVDILALLVHIGRVDEVPVALPPATLSLDEVGPRGTLDESVLNRLIDGPVWIGVSQWRNDVVDSSDGLGRLLLKDLVRDPSCEEVASVPPAVSGAQEASNEEELHL